MALLSKNGKAAHGKHGTQVHAKTAFYSILGAKAAIAGKAGQKNTTAANIAYLEPSRKGLATGKAHLDGLIVSREKGEKKAGLTGQAQPPVKIAGEAHILQALLLQAPEQRKAVPEPEDPKKKVAKNPHHSDGLDQGSSQAAALVAHGVNDLARLDPNRPLPAPTAASADHVVSIPHATARKGPEPRVHILDLRKNHSDSQPEDASTAAKTAKIAFPDRDAAIPVMQRDGGVPENSVHETHRQSPLPPSPLAGALDRLREMAGSELTRAAGIILRDGGGEIKLTLKPESLGNVRIRMNLVDNAIEGRIIVDNTAVKHVFEGSLNSLMRALTAEGFQTASLQVSVGGQNADTGRQDRENDPRARRVDSRKVAAGAGFDWNVAGVENLSLGDLLVNLVV